MASLTATAVEAVLSPATNETVLPPAPITGVWSVAVTVTLRVAVELVSVPSLIWKLTVRVLDEGTTRSFVNWIEASAFCHCSSDAPPAAVSVSTPVLPSYAPLMLPIVAGLAVNSSWS